LALKNGNPSGLGGKRPGAGRKPSPKTILARMTEARLDEECDKSLTFLAEVRDNPKVSWGVRCAAAEYLIDRRKGKPKTALSVNPGGAVSIRFTPAKGAASSASEHEEAED
jgi:hypothetical protein